MEVNSLHGALDDLDCRLVKLVLESEARTEARLDRLVRAVSELQLRAQVTFCFS